MQRFLGDSVWFKIVQHVTDNGIGDGDAVGVEVAQQEQN